MPKLLIYYSKNSLINILFYKKTTKSRCFLTYIFLFSTFAVCFAQFFFENPTIRCCFQPLRCASHNSSLKTSTTRCCFQPLRYASHNSSPKTQLLVVVFNLCCVLRTILLWKPNYSLLFSMKKSNAFIISSKSSFGLSASSRSNPLSLSGLFGFFLIMFLANTLFSSVSSLFK